MINIKNKKIAIFTTVDVFGDVKSGNVQDIRNRMDIFKEMGYFVVLIQFLKKTIDKKNVFFNNEMKVYSLERKDSRRFFVHKNWGTDNKEIFNIISDLLKKDPPNILWFEYSYMSSLASKIKKKFPQSTIYFRSHNYEIGHFSEKWWSNFKAKKSLFLILLFIKNFFYITFLEKQMFKVSKKVFCISRLDIQKFSNEEWLKKIVYLPFYSFYENKYKLKRDCKINVVYLGSDYNNNVNYEGYLNIRKMAKLTSKNIEFHITGKNLSLEEALPNNIIYHGYLDNLEKFLSEMDVAISPNTIGFGMKIKVYEFIKRGFPTLLGARSHKVFGGEHNEDYIVCRTIADYVSSLEDLVDFEKRKKISIGAIKYSEKELSKQNILNSLKEI